MKRITPRLIALVLAAAGPLPASAIVGTATDGLMDDALFQRLAYVFTVCALVGPLGVLVAFGVYFGWLWGWYLVVNGLAAMGVGKKGRRKKGKSGGRRGEADRGRRKVEDV